MQEIRKYPEELVQRGIRSALESERPISAQADSGVRLDLPSSEGDRSRHSGMPSEMQYSATFS